MVPLKGFRAGLLATLPLFPGVAAFGLLYGMMARQAGLTPFEALLMSAMVHAGASQFTAVGMWNASGAAAIILTTLILNLRHLLMGASVAPYLRRLPLRWKALLALWMSDESYALAIAAYQDGSGSRTYFFGANLGIYFIWPVSGLIGALLGAAIPDPARFGLDLVFPLAFLGLVAGFIKNRADILVALFSGAVALLAALILPGKWYVLVAGIAGSLLGVSLEEWGKRWKTS